jgi:hypothetical protein
MSLNRYAKRRDSNEGPIIQALEAAGFHVWQFDLIDLAIRKDSWAPGMLQVLEVKRPGEKTRKSQTRQTNFLSATKAPIVRTPLEALKAVGSI